MAGLGINLIVRLWYAFASKRRDYKEFAVTKRDIVTAPQVIMYYIFVKPSKPHLGKYNVMQKGTYIIFVPLLILQAFTGLSMLTFTIPFTASLSTFGHAGITGWNWRSFAVAVGGAILLILILGAIRGRGRSRTD